MGGPTSISSSHPPRKDSSAASPPPPPPRGSNPAPPTSSYTRSHARSSSLDLNNLQNQSTIRPPLPPRVEAHGVGVSGSIVAAHLGHQRMPSIASLSGMTRDSRALQCKIQEYRENNSVVARTINELHQEVSDALEERIALEYQLEQLKSFGDE